MYTRLNSILPTLGSLGTAFVTSVLGREKLPFKANLLTRVEDVDELEAEDELAVYVWVTNPFKSVAVRSDTPSLVCKQASELEEVIADAC